MSRKLAIVFGIFLSLYIFYDLYYRSIRLTGEKFVKKYANANWDIFQGRNLLFRGYDYKQNQVILFQRTKDIDSSACFWAVTINNDLNRVIDIKNLPDSIFCQVNISAEDSLLILKFASYHFKSLYADKDSNIYIWIAEHTECPHLVRFHNLKYKTKTYENWKDIGKGWFEENL